MNLRYIIVYVDDVPGTLDFYGRAFGIETAFLHECGDYGELATGATRLGVSAKSLMREIGKTPGTADPAAPVFEIAFETQDVAAAVARAVAAGAALTMPPTKQPWGQRIAYVADPNGILVELCTPVQPPSPG